MNELLLFGFAAYGMTNILVWGSIFSSFRNWLYENSKSSSPLKDVYNFFSELLGCMLCTGTWVGFILSMLWFSVSSVAAPIQDMSPIGREIIPAIYVFVDGMFAAGFIWFINTLVEFLEYRKPI